MASEKLFYITGERKWFDDININLEIKLFYKRSFFVNKASFPFYMTQFTLEQLIHLLSLN